MRKALAIILAFLTIIILAGCGNAPRPADNPAISTEDGWSEEYVKVSNGDVILCLWHNRGNKSGTLDCDWDKPNPSTMPEDTVPAAVGYGNWEEEYVKVSTGQTILCLWHNRNGRTGVMSCDWSR